MPAEHIFTFAQTMAGGGVERALLRLCAGWIARGRRVTLLLGTREGPLAAELPAGVEVIDLGDRRYTALLRAAPAAVRDAAPDVIFCPGNHYTSIAAWVRVRLGRGCPPIVGKVSNALVRADKGRLEALAYAFWLRLHPLFLDRLVSMTPAMRAEARATMRMPDGRTRVIANPPALHHDQALPVALPEGRFLLGVGRLAAQKRWERLIAALPRLSDSALSLVILGDGAERAALEAQVAALGLEDRVSLPGYAADPLPAIARAAVVVLTSDFEGVPGVLREAASVGTPVVATDSSVAVREIVGSGGTVVPIGDEAALIAAIEAWLAPQVVRPRPVVQGGNPVGDYLTLFDALTQPRPAPAARRVRDVPTRP